MIGDSGFKHLYQFKLVKFIFDYVIKINIFTTEVNQNSVTKKEIDIYSNEKVRVRIFKEFRKIIYNNKIENFRNKLKNSQDQFLELSQEMLREVGLILDAIKIEADAAGKDSIHQNFMYPIFKALKLIIFISINKNRTRLTIGSLEKVKLIFNF